ncbi:hypothetical protein VCSRO85_3267 [Vibrio cholerae]|nr:hypothetical protein VCSRO85_3267 [Vibrio cholerae]
MRLGELTYLTDQIVTFGFSSLELRNKAVSLLKRLLWPTLNCFCDVVIINFFVNFAGNV